MVIIKKSGFASLAIRCSVWVLLKALYKCVTDLSHCVLLYIGLMVLSQAEKLMEALELHKQEQQKLKEHQLECKRADKQVRDVSV